MSDVIPMTLAETATWFLIAGVCVMGITEPRAGFVLGLVMAAGALLIGHAPELFSP